MSIVEQSTACEPGVRRDVVVVTLEASTVAETPAAQRAQIALRGDGTSPTTRRVSPGGRLLLVATGGLPATGGQLTVGSGAAPTGAPRERPSRSATPLAPWAEVSISGETARLACDDVGLKHLYVTQGRGWAAASTSALVLGAIAGAEPDAASWAAQALLGFSAGTRTVAAGVERVPAGHEAHLGDGRVRLVARSGTPARGRADDGPQVLREVVGELLEAHPNLGLELSGGLDSRVLLAALPRARRPGRTAMTIGSEHDPDVRVAEDLARRQGLDHHVLPPPDASGLEPSAALAAALASGRRREHAGDALAAWVLDDVESRAPSGPRLTGVNGEFARGFYYPATPRHGPVTGRRVARLARWRMFTNHRAAGWLFDESWLASQQRALMEQITCRLGESGLPWRPATDEYYLRERIPNWAGPGYSHAATQRLVVAPFTSPAFLAWARATPPHRRAESQALATLLASLDPELAALPLADGTTPVELARGTATARSVRVGRRLAAKARQRLRDERRSPTGAATLVPSVCRALRDDAVLAELAEVDFLTAEGLERFAAGEVPVDQPTVSFLVNLLGTRRHLAATSTTPQPLERAGGRADEERTR